MTPSEDLMLEALLGRWRLGEKCWTFESRHTATAKKLENRGWVTWKSGIVEKTIIVWMTEKAKSEFLSPEYVPPIMKEEKQ